MVLSLAIMILILSSRETVLGQDNVYLTSGKVIKGKVTEVLPNQVEVHSNVREDGPVYYISVNNIDSIVYANGTKEDLLGITNKKDRLNNIPELNTWNFDLLGFTFLSASQSYERRLKNGKIGFRIPLYIGFIGGGIAGIGLFSPAQGGVFAPNSDGGFSIASGINPKFYLFKRRIVRAFIGPEVTVGYSKTINDNGYNYPGGYGSSETEIIRSGTIAAVGKFGLMLNPVDKFNITIDGGVGVVDMFGPNAIGPVCLWHIGLALGTNF